MNAGAGALLALFALVACDDEHDPMAWPEPDLAAFAEEAQPVLAARCASPSCHGRDDRPLALYAPRMHRLEAKDLYRDLPLGLAELRANLTRVMAFVAENVARSELLTKPLAPEAGGVAHAGGVQFPDASDWDYRALRDWIAAHATVGE